MKTVRTYSYCTVSADDVMTGKPITFGVEYDPTSGPHGTPRVLRIVYPWGCTVPPCSEQFTDVEDIFHLDRMGRDLDPATTDNPDALRFHG